MTRVYGCMVLGVACLAAGCGGPAPGAKELKSVSTRPPLPVDRADGVDFWVAPPAVINWDEKPGPDGVQAWVWMIRVDRPEPVLVKGTLEFMMYSGRVQRGEAPPSEPLKVWNFTPDELAACRVRSIRGWGYAAQLGWGKDTPTVPVITLQARYQPPSGPTVYSAAISIAMPGKVRSGPVKSVLGDPAAAKPSDGTN